MEQPTVYILIGLPASGKSTWREAFIKKNPNFYALSSDDIIDRKCEEAGLTYNEGFKRFVVAATNAFKQNVKKAFDNRDDFIIDRTNMTEKNRRDYIRSADEKGYRKVAVNFIVPAAVLKKRMKDRFDATGKSVPDFVVDSMARGYVPPSKSEGFDEIQNERN